LSLDIYTKTSIAHKQAHVISMNTLDFCAYMIVGVFVAIFICTTSTIAATTSKYNIININA